MTTHLDLCSGIGGFALAAKWAGYDTIGFCEIDPWCRRVLGKNFPGVPQHDDLWTLTADVVRDWIGERTNHDGAVLSHTGSVRSTATPKREQHPEPDSKRQANQPVTANTIGRPRLDLITGGYPCQPFSVAGRRLGEKDDRHLWPAIAALVADLRPARCLFENVGGHVTMGLDAVLDDLEALGYTCWPVVIPACAVGAPHRRDRVWILADSTSIGERDTNDKANAITPEWHARLESSGGDGGRDEREPGADVADTDHAGRKEQRPSIANEEEHASAERSGGGETLGGLGFQDDGVPGWLDGPGRIDPWAGDWEAGVPRTTTNETERSRKLMALGNAIVPQVAYEILRAWGRR